MSRRTSPKILQAVAMVRAGAKPLDVCRDLSIAVPMTLYAALKRYGVSFEATTQKERSSTPEARARRSMAQRLRQARVSLQRQRLPPTTDNVAREMRALYGNA